MSVMEVLTLLLVIFAALSYLDNHKKKQHPYPEKVRYYFFFNLIIPRADRNSCPINLPVLIVHQSRLFYKQLFFTYFYCVFHRIVFFPSYTGVE